MKLRWVEVLSPVTGEASCGSLSLIIQSAAGVKVQAMCNRDSASHRSTTIPDDDPM
ncbi:MAG: hypothetical protein R6U70_05640 [Bacillota bacterium]|jgi:hypothetical protein